MTWTLYAVGDGETMTSTCTDMPWEEQWAKFHAKLPHLHLLWHRQYDTEEGAKAGVEGAFTEGLLEECGTFWIRSRDQKERPFNYERNS
jgi:hypothetical protein